MPQLDSRPLWANVELDIEEEEAVITSALNKHRQEKYARQQAQEKAAQDARTEEENLRPWNAEELYNHLQNRWHSKQGRKYMGFDFKVDQWNEHTFKALLYYFSGDARFEEMGDGWSLEKGIMLAGGVGTGKTSMMKAFTQNKRGCFHLVTSSE